jgi:ABC-type transport system involved in Fe-S cluster assembly fused permease/ATPase subunit
LAFTKLHTVASQSESSPLCWCTGLNCKVSVLSITGILMLIIAGPLIFFSSMYRQISYSLMDAERLLELFQTKPTVTDMPNAKPLKLGQGLVKFDRVSFAYDERKPTLKNVSFVVPPGKTVALVGETGGGKSTILKLIDRFYDVKSGSISIDSQDIRDVCLER